MVMTVQAAPSSSWKAMRDEMVEERMRGVSPQSTTSVPAKPASLSAAHMTVWPVPKSSSW